MEKVHFSGVMNVEFDLNKETGEITNFTMTNVSSSQSKKESKKKEAKPVELTPQEKAEQMPCIFVNPKTQQMRFTRAAAEKLGFLNKEGMVWQTPNGKNMRVAIGFRMQEGGFMPTVSGEFDDSPTSSPMLSDSLRLTCPMACKDIFKNFDILKINVVPTEDGNDKIFVLAKTSVEEMASLYDKMQAATKEVSGICGDTQEASNIQEEGNKTSSSEEPDPQIANGPMPGNPETSPMPINSDDMEDLYHTRITDEDGENANGINSKGEEFIPSFNGEEKIHDSVDDDDDIMSGEFAPKPDDDDIFE